VTPLAPTILSLLSACANAEDSVSVSKVPPAWPSSPPPMIAAQHPAPGERIDLVFGTSLLSAHIADTPAARETGLMRVDALGTDEGMIFVYPAAAPRFFWMKDTLIPLAIAFVGADGRVVGLAEMAVGDGKLTPSQKPAMYAVEAPQGWFASHGVRVGDVVGGLPPASAE
jgi:uncharacterized membrane protein (UPF0127 family)